MKISKQINDWKCRTFLFLLSQGITLFGSLLVQFAIIWYIAKTTTSGSMVSLSTVCSFLPQLLISTFAGVWADRYPRKTMILLSDGCIAIATLILVLLVQNGAEDIWLFLLISAIRSLGAGIQTPAVNAMLPQLVPKEKLMRVNGLNGSLSASISFAAPIAGGAILSVAPLFFILMIDVATAAIGMFLLALIPIHHLSNQYIEKKPERMSELRAGFLYCFKQKWLKQLLILYIGYTILVIPAGYLNVLLVARLYPESYLYLTLNEVAFFVGMTAGGLLLGAWGGFKNRLHTLAIGILLFGAGAILMGTTINFWLYLVTVCLTGFSVPLAGSSFNVIMQERTPEQMQGRVFGIAMAVNSMFMQLGMLAFGPLSDVVSIELLMVTTGMSLLLLAIWTIRAGRQKTEDEVE